MNTDSKNNVAFRLPEDHLRELNRLTADRDQSKGRVAKEIVTAALVDASRQAAARLAGQSAFVLMNDTSHVGLTWSDVVAELIDLWLDDRAQITDGSSRAGG